MHLEGSLLHDARTEAKARRTAFNDAGFKAEKLDPNELKVTFPQDGPPGWQGGQVDLWRVQAEGYYWQQLITRRDQFTPEWEWLSPWVDVEEVRRNRRSWTELWFYDLAVIEVPRSWMRTSLAALQATRKTTKGTPGDNQIGIHLLDVTWLATADRAFYQVLATAKDRAPYPTGTPVHIDRDDVVGLISSLDANSATTEGAGDT